MRASPLDVEFHGELRPEQATAAEDMLRPRYGRSGGHDRLWQDRGRRVADRPARRQHAGPGASPPVVGAMGRTACRCSSACRRRRSAGSAAATRSDRLARCGGHSKPGAQGRCQGLRGRIWPSHRGRMPPSVGPQFRGGRPPGQGEVRRWGSPPPSPARTATIRSSSCSAARCVTASMPRPRPPPVPSGTSSWSVPRVSPAAAGRSGRADAVPDRFTTS